MQLDISVKIWLATSIATEDDEEDGEVYDLFFHYSELLITGLHG